MKNLLNKAKERWKIRAPLEAQLFEHMLDSNNNADTTSVKTLIIKAQSFIKDIENILPVNEEQEREFSLEVNKISSDSAKSITRTVK